MTKLNRALVAKADALTGESWCYKCQNHRPAAGFTIYIDGKGKQRRICGTCTEKVRKR